MFSLEKILLGTQKQGQFVGGPTDGDSSSLGPTIYHSFQLRQERTHQENGFDEDHHCPMMIGMDLNFEGSTY